MSLLEYVGLHSMASETAGELSYGQQKLLTLACCLATGAKILFLDEPTAGVHPDMTAQFLRLLHQLRKDGKLLIFIEHEISVVRELAEHVVVMDKGRIIAEGSPVDVLKRPEIAEAYLA
jgi:ABC-type branched-subunit amino acid transport system ATPase component